MPQSQTDPLSKLAIYLLGVVFTALVGVIAWTYNGMKNKIEILFGITSKLTEKSASQEKDIENHRKECERIHK